MRIAILCSGLEHTNRGFEAFSRSLFYALRDEGVDVTLFKGSGRAAKGEIVVPCLRRNATPSFVSPQRAYDFEQMSFALAVAPRLRLGDFDVIHYSDGRIGNALSKIPLFGKCAFPLLLSNGAPFSPAHIKRGIFIHQVSLEHYRTACEFGISPDSMYLVPYGLNPERFEAHVDRELVRDKFGLPKTATVVLSLAALNISHKRADHLIRELAASQDKSLFLCLAGQEDVETPAVRKLAAEALPGRCRLMTLKWQDIPDLLAASDVFVLPSVSEGFGMVLLEAMAAGVPVIAHSSEHFRWILDSAGETVDMREKGELSNAISLLVSDPGRRRQLGDWGRRRVSECFSWKSLVPQYLEMYSRVASRDRLKAA